MFAKLLVRDASIVGVSVLAWQLAASWSSGSGALSDLTGVVLGLLLGACAFLLHEWSHLLGAVAGRSRVEPPASLRSPFVFRFDSRSNSRAQFLVMSFTGFAATAVALWVAYALLPSELLATRVARGVVMFLALLGIVLEFPLVVYSLVAGRVPPVDGVPDRKPAQRVAA